MRTTQLTTTHSTTGWLGKPLAAIALLAGLAACGSTDPSGTSPSSTPTSPGHSTVTVSPPHDFAEAKQVTVVQSGGLKPVHKTFVFAMDRPAPDGFTKADVKAVLRAAGNPALKTAPTPGDTCCDRYLYRISISYPDGTSTTFTTVEGASTIPAVSHLLTLAT